MATIVFLDGIDEIIGSRRGITFDRSQAGNYAKKRPSPTNPHTNSRSKLRLILKEVNTYFWALPPAKKTLWSTWAAANNISGPWGMLKDQQACAAFFTVALNARLAGYPLYQNPPGNLPAPGVTFTNLTRIDKDTVRATFNPSPSGAWRYLYLRQALPGPGVRRWSTADGYIAEYTAQNVNSPYDFTTKFQHLAGWHCRYWCGSQYPKGNRSIETMFDL